MFNVNDCINSDRIREYLEQALTRSGSKEKMAKMLGVRYRTVISWFKGATPTPNSLTKLVNYLNGPSIKAVRGEDHE